MLDAVLSNANASSFSINLNACLLSFSGLYGTFLCDTERRRARLKMKQKTLSVWTVVLDNREAFVHPGYKATREPLWPSLAPTKVILIGMKEGKCRRVLRPLAVGFDKPDQQREAYRVVS